MYCRVNSQTFQFNGSLAYGWKLGLVAISVLPVLVFMAFSQMRLIRHLQDDLRDAYGKSAALACEQVAAIRTVASLRREDALLEEFRESMNAPVRKAMIATTKSTFVQSLFEDPNLDFCIQPGCSTFH